jgi:hypothetical protein
MTYLQLVNKVLTRLREDTVSTVAETPYSALIGEFVNDAKQLVEDAWDWSALRTTLTVTTSANTFNYNLTGTGNRVTILDVVNDTSNNFMTYKDAHWFNDKFLNTDPAVGSPFYYTFNGIDANGDTAVDVYPVPNGVYALRFNSILRTGQLESDTDAVNIPTLPIIHIAFAMALRERGETGGQSAAEAYAYADRVMSDAIALDASKHPEETIYAVV